MVFWISGKYLKLGQVLNVPLVSFSNPGFHTIYLSGDDGDCTTTFEDSIYIFDEPSVEINLQTMFPVWG